jgi:hypothetical protein
MFCDPLISQLQLLSLSDIGRLHLSFLIQRRTCDSTARSPRRPPTARTTRFICTKLRQPSRIRLHEEKRISSQFLSALVNYSSSKISYGRKKQKKQINLPFHSNLCYSTPIYTSTPSTCYYCPTAESTAISIPNFTILTLP